MVPKPETMSLFSKIVIFILLALYTAWPYFENIKKYTWVKRFLYGLGLVLLIGFGVIDIISTENKSDKQDLKIEALQKSVTSVGSKIDSMGYKIDKSGRLVPKEQPKPLMAINVAPTAPVIEPEMVIDRDSSGFIGTFWSLMKIRLRFHGVNSTTAYVRDIKIISFTWDKHGLADLSTDSAEPVFNAIASYNGSPVDATVRYIIPVPRDGQSLVCFYYFKLRYADKAKGGKVINPPLRGLFYIERLTYNPKSWSDIKFGFVDDQLQLKRTMDTLKKRKVW